MKRKKWYRLASLLILVVVLLSGCVSTDRNNILWQLIGNPMEELLTYFAHFFTPSENSYGYAIIIVTLIVKLFVLPLNLQMSKSMIVQQERTLAYKEYTDPIQKRMTAAQSQEEKLYYYQQLQVINKQAGITPISAGGCLPMLIQMPIVSMLYLLILGSEPIKQSTFFGISLGASSVVLAIVAAVFYFIQGLISQIGMTPEQLRMNKSLLWVSPIMTGYFSLITPAGAALYMAVGGLFACVQQLFVTFVHKPKIRQKVQEDIKNNPIKIEVPELRKEAKPVTPDTAERRNRNAGKQQKRR